MNNTALKNDHLNLSLSHTQTQYLSFSLTFIGIKAISTLWNIYLPIYFPVHLWKHKHLLFYLSLSLFLLYSLSHPHNQCDQIAITITICPVQSTCQSRFKSLTNNKKPAKKLPKRLWKFCQSDEILPNLVTLLILNIIIHNANSNYIHPLNVKSLYFSLSIWACCIAEHFQTLNFCHSISSSSSFIPVFDVIKLFLEEI